MKEDNVDHAKMLRENKIMYSTHQDVHMAHFGAFQGSCRFCGWASAQPVSYHVWRDRNAAQN